MRARLFETEVTELDTLKKTFTLSPQACDEAAALVKDFCDRVKTGKSEALRYRLAVEECLLNWIEYGFEGKPVILRMGQRMLEYFILLEVAGEAFNPYENGPAGYGELCQSVLVMLRLHPNYTYTHGKNRLFFRVKRKTPGQMAALGIAVAAAVILGLLGKFVFPENVSQSVLDGLITPLYGTFFRILGCMAGPLIFFSVTWGIYGIGDAETFGRIGRKLMLRYFLIVFFVTGCSAAVFPFFTKNISLHSAQNTELSTISNLILGIFPGSLVEPFYTGNSLQIILLAIVGGVSLLCLGKQTEGLARGVEQCNYLIQYVMEIVGRLMPLVVFLIIVNMIMSDNYSALQSVWRLVIVLAAVLLIMAAVFTVYTSWRCKVKPMLIVKKSLKLFLLGFSTGSSAASFGSCAETCEKKFGINSSLVSFGAPLGMVLLRPVVGLYFLLMALFFAGRYDLAITIDIILDFPITAFSVYTLPLTLTGFSYGVTMIDREVLRSPENV